ncbi:MAG: hypothetical protein QM608_21175, partial [Caulobacter sp.]
MRVPCLAACLLVAPLPALAAPTSLSMFSRANCLTYNESLSWDGRGALQPEWEFNLATESLQFFDTIAPSRFIETGWAVTWRSYAGCNFCGSAGWSVEGWHYATTSGIKGSYVAA